MRTWISIAFCMVVGLILILTIPVNTSAVDPLNIQDQSAMPTGNLSEKNLIGQTFTFHHSYLNAIEVRWVVSEDFKFMPTSRVILHVRHSIDDSSDLATSSMALNTIQNNNYAKFVFPSIRASKEQSFYFVLDISQTEIQQGNISLWSSAEDSYPDGQLFSNKTPIGRDLAFRAYYEPDPIFLLQSLIETIRRQGVILFLLLLIFLVPGLALLVLLNQTPRLRTVEVLAISGGLGLAFLSAESIFLLAFGLSIQWLAISFLAACLILCFVFGKHVFNREPKSIRIGKIQLADSEAVAAWGLPIFACISLCLALIQIRDLQVPLWVDTPFYAANIKAALESDHLPLYTFYHFGFHSIVTLLIQISKAPIPIAMLLVGQLLITQTGLSVFALSKRLSGSSLAGLIAAICVWFLSPSPSYFVNWGRYTLLLGCAILPIAMLFAIELIDQANLDLRISLLAIITCAGLAFAHIRLVPFYASFVIVYFVFRLKYWNRAGIRCLSEALWISIVVGGGLFLVGIWLAAVLANFNGLDLLARNAETASAISTEGAFTISILHYGSEIWALAVMGLIVGAVKQIRGTLLPIAWYGVLTLSALLIESAIGSDYLPPSLIILVGFVPASLVIGKFGYGVYSEAAKSRGPKLRLVMNLLLFAILFVISGLGAWDLSSLVKPATILYSKADAKAMNWIQTQIPADQKFLVNSFNWFNGIYRVSDGGGWMPYITGNRVESLDFSISNDQASSDVLARWINEKDIRYLYLGRRQGVLHKSYFFCRPERFTLLYNLDGVQIFLVNKDKAQIRTPRLDHSLCPR